MSNVPPQYRAAIECLRATNAELLSVRDGTVAIWTLIRGQRDEIERLSATNAELLAALESVCRPDTTADEWYAAQAAIAKAKETT